MKLLIIEHTVTDHSQRQPFLLNSDREAESCLSGVPEDCQTGHGSSKVQLRLAVLQLLLRGQVEQLPSALL